MRMRKARNPIGWVSGVRYGALGRKSGPTAYVGNLRPGTPQEVATEESLNTAYGVERIVRDAFARATRRKAQGHQGRVTLVHKTNVLVHAGALWLRVFEAVAADFPNIPTHYCHADAASMFQQYVLVPGRRPGERPWSRRAARMTGPPTTPGTPTARASLIASSSRGGWVRGPARGTMRPPCRGRGGHGIHHVTFAVGTLPATRPSRSRRDRVV